MDSPTLQPSELAVAINQAHGQAVESRHVSNIVGNAVRDQLAITGGQADGAITRAARSVRDKLSRRIGQAQSTIDQTMLDLSGTLMQQIEGAAIPLVELGIELPTADQIAAIKAGLAPSPSPSAQGQTGQLSLTGTVQGPGLSPAGGIVGANGSGGQWPYTCLVHLLPPEQQIYYLTLVQLVDNSYAVSAWPQYQGQPPKAIIRKFPTWYSAELACRLISECGWTIQKLIPYWRPIDAVSLGSVSSPSLSGYLCVVAQQVFDTWLGAMLTSTPVQPQSTQSTQSQGTQRSQSGGPNVGVLHGGLPNVYGE